MPPLGSMTWNDAADRKLLLGILKMQDVKVDCEAMATYMGCTASAIQNRMKKLKALSKEALNDADGEGSATPKPKASPRKRTASQDPPSASSKKKGKAGKVSANNEDDEEDVTTPAIKDEDF